MVGGIVIEASESKSRPELVFIDCRGTGGERGSTCAIYVEKNEASLQIEVGDSVWWQDRKAYWTPKSEVLLNGERGHTDDFPIPRIGYSGVGHPDFQKIESE